MQDVKGLFFYPDTVIVPPRSHIFFNLEFPVACHRDDIFLAFGCGRKADNTTRIALCLADTLSYSISREVS